MKKVIRLNEQELKKLIKESIKEFEDWKAQLLYGDDGIDKYGYDIDGPNVEKANDLLRKKYGVLNSYEFNELGREDTSEPGNTASVHPHHGYISTREDDPDKPDGSEILHMTDNDGREFVDVWEDPAGIRYRDFDIHKKDNDDKPSINYSIDGVGGHGGDEYMKSFIDDESGDLQKRLSTDMVDFYSGSYKDRLKRKLSRLGNASSGQDFTPSALNEAVNRVIRKYLR